LLNSIFVLQNRKKLSLPTVLEQWGLRGDFPGIGLQGFCTAARRNDHYDSARVLKTQAHKYLNGWVESLAEQAHSCRDVAPSPAWAVAAAAPDYFIQPLQARRQIP
jgi:hypothetical protein